VARIPSLPTSKITSGTFNANRIPILGRGAYSAIVYKDGSYTVAEDSEGTQISKNTNARTTIQAVIDALTSGGRVFICNGTYDIPSQINCNQADIDFCGGGTGAILKQTASFDFMFYVTADRVHFDSIKIDGNKAVAGNAARNIHFYQCDYGEVRNSYFLNPGYGAVRASGVKWLNVFGNTILNSGVRAIYVSSSSDYVMVKNNTVQNTGEHGIAFELNVHNSEICGNIVKDSTKFGISLYNACNRNLIGNNTIYSCGYDNINITNVCLYTSVIGNVTTDCGESGVCFWTNCDYAIVNNNMCYNNYGYGLDLDSLRYATVIGNHCKNNSRGLSGQYPGIGIHHVAGNSSTNNVIVGNFSSGPMQNYGIKLEAATDDYNVVVGNHVMGNVSGGVYNPTANSEVAHNMA
jgi:parallel beta-helix repeat protein